MNVNHTQSYYTTLRTMNPAQYYKLSSLKQLQEASKVINAKLTWWSGWIAFRVNHGVKCPLHGFSILFPQYPAVGIFTAHFFIF